MPLGAARLRTSQDPSSSEMGTIAVRAGKERFEYAMSSHVLRMSGELRIWSLDRKLELSGRSVRVEDGGASRLSKHKTGGFQWCWLAGGEVGRGGLSAN